MNRVIDKCKIRHLDSKRKILHHFNVQIFAISEKSSNFAMLFSVINRIINNFIDKIINSYERREFQQAVVAKDRTFIRLEGWKGTNEDEGGKGF